MSEFWLYASGAAVALVAAVVARTVRWRGLVARNPSVVWVVGSVGQVRIDAADVLWHTTLLEPQKLAGLVHDLAYGWARRRVLRDLYNLMADTVQWLRDHASHPDIMPGIADLTHLEVVLGLDDCVHTLGSANDDLSDHLVDWMNAVPDQPDVIGSDLVLAGATDAPVGVGDAISTLDVFGGSAFLGSLVVLRQGLMVAKGGKSLEDGVKDGGVEFLAKSAGGMAAGAAVFLASPAGIPVMAVGVAVAAGRLAAGGIVKWMRKTELRKLRRKLRAKVCEVGSELFSDGRDQQLRDIIWAPWKREYAALSVIAHGARRNRLQITYWIWPTPQHVMYVLARRKGRASMKAAKQQAEAMTANLTTLAQSPNRDVLAGKLLIRSPRLVADLNVPSRLVRETKWAHDEVKTEAERLRARHGYR